MAAGCAGRDSPPAPRQGGQVIAPVSGKRQWERHRCPGRASSAEDSDHWPRRRCDGGAAATPGCPGGSWGFRAAAVVVAASGCAGGGHAVGRARDADADEEAARHVDVGGGGGGLAGPSDGAVEIRG